MTVDELERIEEVAVAHLDGGRGEVEAELDAAAAGVDTDAEEEPADAVGRLAVAVATSTLGAAAMVGGIFNGAAPRVYAAVAGLLGIGVAVVAARMRSTLASLLVAAGGIFAIGVVLVIPSGGDALVNLGGNVHDAVASGRSLRPPIDLSSGWIAVLSWVMAVVGFAAAWTAISIRRPSLALLAPLPFAGIACISVPQDQQLPSGIVVLVLFAAGLGIVSGARGGGERRPLSYELRRGARALPVLAVVTGGIYVLASQSSFLFPHPLVDPANQAQKPNTVPLSDVPDNVLFEVKSSLTGPWVVGTLDVYDAQDGSWRLPPFAESQLNPVPSSGFVDSSLKAGIRATITIRSMTGAVLPGLPNTVLIVASGPRLAFDSRSQNIRIVEGQLQNGFTYDIGSAALPSVGDLQKDSAAYPRDLAKFMEMPSPPQDVRDLIASAPRTDRWDEFDYLSRWVLHNITATGVGVPVAVPVSRVEEILSRKQASPFEIIALQTMLARWAGMPARIGYGFDGGDSVDGTIQVHPRNGAAFPEVYFPGHEWLPVIRTPERAQATQGTDPRFQQQRTDIQASDDIAVPIFLPAVEPPDSQLYETVRVWVLVAIVVLAVAGLMYVLLPVAVKALRRSRRRAAAQGAGPRARLVQAYSEWRDLATDYGYRYSSDTPLMFVERFVPDEDHTELAWLVTRALWGDLRGRVDDAVAADAGELSRSLRGRLAAAQPISVRLAAALSRLSLREPFDERALTHIRKEDEDAFAVVA